MSGQSFRRGPNVSQYIANLNVQSPQDFSSQAGDALTGIDDSELALFTNTEFTNTEFLDSFDIGDGLDFDSGAAGVGKSEMNDISKAEDGEVDYGSGLSYGIPQHAQHLNPYPNASYDLSFASQAPFFAQQPTNQAIAPAQPRGSIPSRTSAVPAKRPHPITTSSPAIAAAGHNASSSNSLSTPLSATSPTDPESSARAAAEEDKRRRNTAASARFRVKKKQREQALEKTAREMTEKNEGLEKRIGELEQENRWLKNLLVEKNAGSAATSAPSSASESEKQAESETASASSSLSSSRKKARREEVEA